MALGSLPARATLPVASTASRRGRLDSLISTSRFRKTIGRYWDEQCRDPDGRGRSWEYCYEYFREHCGNLRQVPEDTAALHLGFYLASWGMYRGPFLREHAYTVHKPVIRALVSRQFSNLWQHDVGTHDADVELATAIMELAREVETEYRERMGKQQQKNTDVLVTKVLLGTVGCLPARDTFFEKGFKAQPYVYGDLNEGFVQRILTFCVENRSELAKIQSIILELSGLRYPFMKLVDMHFWQIGRDL